MPKINFSIVHIAKKNTRDLTAMFSQRKAKDKEQRSFLFKPPIEMSGKSVYFGVFESQFSI